MSNKEYFEAIEALENDTNLKVGFFKNLLTEDDWSFIIKIHALYEAAVSKLILSKIAQPELEDFVFRLELGDKSRGKLKLSKDLGLLNDKERRFISALSEIRNCFVHNVSNTHIELDEYLKRLSKDKRNHYVKTFGYSYGKTITIAGTTMDTVIFTRDNPKIAIWHNSMHVLAVISNNSSAERNLHKLKNTIIKINDKEL